MTKTKLKKESITVMIPAYNEEKYLETTVTMVNGILENLFADYEILIFDDCSSDKTAKIADALSGKNSRIKVVHNKENKGIGYNFRTGAKIAGKQHYCSIMADIDTLPDSIRRILEQTGNADFIASYMQNDDRPFYRKIISKGFTTVLNFLFGLHLKYYCGVIVFNTNSLRKIKMRTDSFAMNAEVIIQLAKQGKSYRQIPYVSTAKGRTEESNVFRLKNVFGVLRTIMILFFENLSKIVK